MRRSLGKMSKRSRALGHAGRSLTVPALVLSFQIGERVCLDPQVKYGGMPHPRYRGRTGVICGLRGKSYVVRIADGNMQKELIIPSMHLRRVGSTGKMAAPGKGKAE